jgi:hypothetical protein
VSIQRGGVDELLNVAPVKGTLNFHSCVMTPHHAIPIRKFVVTEVRAYAQYERSVAILFVRTGKRNPESTRICPDNGSYVTIEVGGVGVYDSRIDVPCDMDAFNASRAKFDSRYG